MKQTLDISLSQKLLKQFQDWCKADASQETCDYYTRRLIEIDSGEKDIEDSRWHITAYKKLAKYLCEEKGNKKACGEYKRVKSRKSNPDNYIPPDHTVKELVKGLHLNPLLSYFYYILVQSGLRAKEAVRLLNNGPEGCEDLGGYYRCPILWKRGTKQALWGYLIELPRKIDVGINKLHDMRYAYGTLGFKYVRKWVATKMLLAGMQEIAVDFAQGRVPDSVLRKHYANRLVVTDREYGKYAEWLRGWL